MYQYSEFGYDAEIVFARVGDNELKSTYDCA
jgi:hypothetical protein